MSFEDQVIVSLEIILLCYDIYVYQDGLNRRGIIVETHSAFRNLNSYRGVI